MKHVGLLVVLTLAIAAAVGTPSPAFAREAQDGDVVHVCIWGSGGYGFNMLYYDGAWHSLGVAHFASCEM